MKERGPFWNFGLNAGKPVEPYDSEAFGRKVTVLSGESSAIPGMNGDEFQEVGKGYVVVEDTNSDGTKHKSTVHKSILTIFKGK